MFQDKYKHCTACKKIILAANDYCVFCGCSQKEKVLIEQILIEKETPIAEVSEIDVSDTLNTNTEISEKETVEQVSENDNPIVLNIDTDIEENITVKNPTKRSIYDSIETASFSDKTKSGIFKNKKAIFCFVSLAVFLIVLAKYLGTNYYVNKHNSYLNNTVLNNFDDLINTDSSNDPLACIVVAGLRTRTEPNGKINKISLYNYDHEIVDYLNVGCYQYYDSYYDGKYNWLKLDENRWSGTLNDWVIFRNLNDYDNAFVINERANNKFDFYDPLKNTGGYYFLKGKEKIKKFLKQTVPGLDLIDFGNIIPDFNSYSPSKEAKTAIFDNLSFINTQLATEYKGYVYGSDTYMQKMTDQYELSLNDTTSFFNGNELMYKLGCLNANTCYYISDNMYDYNKWSNYVLKEDFDWLTSMYYDVPLDFTDIGEYDAESQIYSEKHFDCVGQNPNIPYVLEYSTKSDILTVVFSVLEGIELDDGRIDVFDMNYSGSSDKELRDYVNNNYVKYLARIRVMNDGSYRLISVNKY